jgi:hypothetical protein
LNIPHEEIWTLSDIPDAMDDMEPGDILLVRTADELGMDLVAAHAVACGSGFTIVIDEVDRYNSSKELKDLIHYSRWAKAHIVCNTRRYADMPRLITSQADQLYFFQTHEPADLEYLRKLAGKEFYEQVQKLPQYSYAIFPTGEIKRTRLINV